MKEVLRENKRMINRSIRELDRERVNLQNNEKKLIVDIKKAAKDGQMVRDKWHTRLVHARCPLATVLRCRASVGI
jgi:hypothetical protein